MELTIRFSQKFMIDCETPDSVAYCNYILELFFKQCRHIKSVMNVSPPLKKTFGSIKCNGLVFKTLE